MLLLFVQGVIPNAAGRGGSSGGAVPSCAVSSFVAPGDFGQKLDQCRTAARGDQVCLLESQA